MSLTVRALFWFLIVSATTSLVFEGWRRIPDQSPAFNGSDDPGDLSSLVTFRRAHTGVEHRALDSVRTPWNGDEKFRVSAIILNWSRFRNVVLIVSGLCDPRLQGVITEIVVWNNNPRKISAEVSMVVPNVSPLLAYHAHPLSRSPRDLCQEFPVSCDSRIRIVNSPENLYFQARFMACSSSISRYCFIQACRAHFSPSASGGGS